MGQNRHSILLLSRRDLIGAHIFLCVLFRFFKRVNGKESAEKCANIREKILEHAKQKPGYEEKAAIRREKRKANKQAKKEAKRKAAKIEREETESSEVLGKEN